MKERERILELVKQGIISTEEALVLLESAAKKEGKEAVKKDQSNVQKPIPPTEPEAKIENPEPVLSDAAESVEEGRARLEKEQKEDHERLEAILEELANEASGYSVELDQTNQTIKELTDQIKLKKEEMMVIETKEELETFVPDELDSFSIVVGASRNVTIFINGEEIKFNEKTPVDGKKMITLEKGTTTTEKKEDEN